MTTLVHVTASPGEDSRCRLLASAIRQYLQADTQTQSEPEPEPEPAETETGTHIQAETQTQTQTEPGTGTGKTAETTEIHPPPPQTSSHPFTSHITPTLAMLAAKLPLQRMYRPLRQSRPLGVWERGYWLYSYSDIHPGGDPGGDPSTGTGTGNRLGEKDKDGIWPFLTEIIQQGKAGWGVWGVRKQSEDACQIKVYCWGEVVPYIYLLFLVGSDRHVRNRSLQWRDAADHVVVQM